MPLHARVASGVAYGAIGGAAGAFLNTTLDANGNIPAPLDVAMTTMVGGLLAGAVGANAQGAATAAENETLNNWLSHVRPKPMSLSQAEQYQQAVAAGDVSTQDKLAALSAQNDQNLAQACGGGTGSAGCQGQIQAAQAGGHQVYTTSLGSGLTYTYANPLSYASGPETFPFSYASGPQITALPAGPSLGAATLETMQGSPLAGAAAGLVYAFGGSNANAYPVAQLGAATDGVLAGFARFQMPEAPTLLGPTADTGYYIPRSSNGTLILLPQRAIPGVGDVPTPLPEADGAPHTILGGKLAIDGDTVYRQTATFPGGDVAIVGWWGGAVGACRLDRSRIFAGTVTPGPSYPRVLL